MKTVNVLAGVCYVGEICACRIVAVVESSEPGKRTRLMQVKVGTILGGEVAYVVCQLARSSCQRAS